MMKDIFPPVEVLLELEPQEIAQYLLPYLNQVRVKDNKNKIGRLNEIGPDNSVIRAYVGDNQHLAAEVSKVLSEAWAWLEAECFLVGDITEYQGNWKSISRKGLDILKPEDFKNYIHLKLIPKGVMDSILEKKIWSTFIRGDFEIAIFAAFREVEVRIRTVGGYPNTDIGVPLARKAFNPSSGPLTDTGIIDPGEKQAHSDLFAGALGSFKNPSSHRDVDYTDPVIAASLILHANTLIKIIESRKKP